MASVRQKSTGPERLVQNLLRKLDFNFRTNDRELPGSPDIVFRRARRAIFVHGCFWHGHDCAHGRVQAKTNTSFWVQKILSNQLRDAAAEKRLAEAGWRVLTLWECDLRSGIWIEQLLSFLRED